MIRTRRLEGRFWRILSPRWAHDPLSGEGAARHGGRWNRPGQAALYLSREVETAFAEYQQELGTRPGTFVAYDVGGARVHDLTDRHVAASLEMAEADLFAPWKQIAFVQHREPPGWRLADRLAGRADGLVVPSAQRRGGTSLVLWRWNEKGVTVRVLDPHEELGTKRP